MNEKELRELDVQVHKVLWPNESIELGHDTWARDRSGRLPSFFVTRGGKSVPVPHYSTDIGAWEPVCALMRDLWLWDTREFYGYVDVTLYYDIWREDPLPTVTNRVTCDEARGLAAYALGRARCVIAWAGRGEG